MQLYDASVFYLWHRGESGGSGPSSVTSVEGLLNDQKARGVRRPPSPEVIIHAVERQEMRFAKVDLSLKNASPNQLQIRATTRQHVRYDLPVQLCLGLTTEVNLWFDITNTNTDASTVDIRVRGIIV